MIELLVMLFVGWLLLRWLRPKPGELAALWPAPAPSITIHVHGHVLVQPAAVHRKGAGEGLNSSPVSYD
jgi:hypothetical protein